eukprot:GHRQ01024191.1.p1 GENE.GHRQ01024191.1~~GHRQ01024191.1.p1  ORF type:complete len:123 (+),score=18.24 GHRQ01024191.1:745-1113(+)
MDLTAAAAPVDPKAAFFISLFFGGYCKNVGAYAQQDADQDDVYAEVALRAHLQQFQHHRQRQARGLVGGLLVSDTVMPCMPSATIYDPYSCDAVLLNLAAAGVSSRLVRSASSIMQRPQTAC